VIRSGVTIGNPGYDFKFLNGELKHTAHVGGIIIREGAEIGSNSCIEKSTFPNEYTVIDKEAKIGSQCYVAHGVRIGKRVLMPNNVSVSGYTIIEDDVSIGPGAVISNLIKIGKGAHVAIGAVVGTSIKEGEHVAGNFALEYDTFMNIYLESMRNNRKGS
jgi:UDP-3-O-[3-hydroxymyristoyl] glucosamine N-acyltransferase